MKFYPEYLPNYKVNIFILSVLSRTVINNIDYNFKRTTKIVMISQAAFSFFYFRKNALHSPQLKFILEIYLIF